MPWPNSPSSTGEPRGNNDFTNHNAKPAVNNPSVDDGKETVFRREIATAINKVSKENGSNTPDFILAEYLADCLTAFDKASRAREKWYGKELHI